MWNKLNSSCHVSTTPSSREKLAGNVARPIIALCVISVALVFTAELTTILIPFFKMIIETVASELTVVSLIITKNLLDTVIVLEASVALPHAGSMPVRITSSTLAAHAVQLSVIFILVLALTTERDQICRTGMLGTPVLLLLQSMDTPVVLIGGIFDLLQVNAQCSDIYCTGFVWWMNIMNNGGRIVFPMVAGLLISSSFTRFKKRTQSLANL